VPVPRIVFGLTAAPPVALLTAAQARATQSVEKLAGLKVGLAAPGVPEHTWLVGILARAGVTPGQIQLVSLGSRGLEAALDAAEVHAGLVHEPAASRLLAGGRATLLADLRSPAAVAGALGNVTVSAGLFVRPDRPVAERDMVGFLRALLAAEDRLRTANAAVIAGRLPAGALGAPEDFETRIQATRDLYLPQGRVTADQVRHTIALIRGHAPLPARLKLPRPEDMLHLEPLRKALAASRR
jgi:NitT/TauT family transport system substrate-binding protein